VTAPSSRPVVVLPAEGPLRARILALLAQAQVLVADAPSPELDIAIIDLTAPGAEAARLALQARAPRMAVLGVVQPSRSVDQRVLEVVAHRARSTSELVARLWRLRARLVDAQQDAVSCASATCRCCSS
jgi:hypothetical protein